MKYFVSMFFVAFLAIFPTSFLVYDYCLSVQFNRDCGDYLKLAADANSIEIAKQRLDKALLFIETRQLTSGNTSILWSVPTNDLGEWYRNLKSAQRNLENFPVKASETDISTALVKLRETLVNHTLEDIK